MRKSPVWTFIGAALVALAMGGSTQASTGADGELGVIGPVYPIKEQDFLEYIKQRLAAMQASGELRRLQEREAAIARKRIERPRPVPGITRTLKPRVFHVDPTVTLDHAVSDAKGLILYMPGTKVNPFDYLAMSKHLLFIDGDDMDQVAWAAAMDKRYGGHVKTVLVAGSPVGLMQRWKRRVYFDQHGVLTGKFHIRHVPAIVSQDKKQLRVAEVLP